MTYILNRDLSVDLGEEIINHISQKCILPDFGVVAGQAVASAIYDLYGNPGIKGPYNDIDLFISVDTEKNNPGDLDAFIKSAEIHQNKINISVQTELGKNGNAYGSHFLIGGVKKTSTIGILNLTLMERQNVNALELIKSFDFNEVQVGIDLHSKKLYWSSEFNHFLSNQILKADNISNGRTMTRALKKVNEMPWAKMDENLLAKMSLDANVKLCIQGKKYLGNDPNEKYLPDAMKSLFKDAVHIPELGFHYPKQLSSLDTSSPDETPWSLPTAGDLIKLRTDCELGKIKAVRTALESGRFLPYQSLGATESWTSFDKTSKTPLTEASRFKRIELMSYLVSYPTRQSDMNDALVAAVIEKHVESANKMINEGADIHQKDQFGNSILLLPILNNDLTSYKNLISKGLDPLQMAKDSKSLLDLYMKYAELHPETINKLIEDGHRLDRVASITGQIGFLHAISREDVSEETMDLCFKHTNKENVDAYELVRWLIQYCSNEKMLFERLQSLKENGYEIDATKENTSNLQTLVSNSMHRQDITKENANYFRECVRLFSSNFKGNYKNSPYQGIASTRGIEQAKVLLKEGVPLYEDDAVSAVKEHDPMKLLVFMAYGPDYEASFNKLIIDEACKRLIHQINLRSGSKLDAKDLKTLTSLHCAVLIDDPVQIAHLIENGANPDAVTANGLKPFDLLMEKQGTSASVFNSIRAKSITDDLLSEIFSAPTSSGLSSP